MFVVPNIKIEAMRAVFFIAILVLKISRACIIPHPFDVMFGDIEVILPCFFCSINMCVPM